MSIVSELFFYICSQDLTTILTYSGLAILPIAGAVVGGNNSGGCSCSDCAGDHNAEPRDIEPLKKEAAELENLPARSIEQSEKLADIYAELATIAYDEGEHIDTIIMLLDRAEKTLKNTLAQGEDAEIRRKLSNIYTQRAIIYNDFDDLDSAIDSYSAAFAALKPLDDSGDGEAKYDLAGIQLNRGVLSHEKGDFANAKTDFDESFLAFRAVEKISDLDTRYFMAKVSIAQGTLFRDMDESLEKVVDAYNRAMRLLVELIDIGQMEHERELANVLLDRCTATYESYRDGEFETETEKANKINDILIDVGRGIEILERIVKTDPQFESRIDLFNAVATEGSILLDMDKFEEAINAFNRIIKEFEDFSKVDDPTLLLHFISALENRSVCFARTGIFDKALVDATECIKLAEKIKNIAQELNDDEEESDFLLHTVTFYANRANIYKAIGKKEEAIKDYESGYQIIEKLKKSFGNDLDDIAEIFNDIKNQIDAL
ncbi:MAG: hypothetical protein LBB88_10935 [Planctomycetaceae bacterium]|jgi:tetratricopeptide (TPR) repeat protein|nr:hypothetical protein [Planctomycetaceae bacterium]